MSIVVTPKENAEGRYVLAIDGPEDCTLYLEVEDVPLVQSKLSSALIDIQRRLADRSASSPTVVVHPMTSLRWTREGAGSHSYVAVAPGGVVLRVSKNGTGQWSAEAGGRVLDTFDKKRQAQVVCEQTIGADSASVKFLEEK